MVFKRINCLLPGKRGGICKRHLGDVEAGAAVTVRYTCSGKHSGDTDKIEFRQDDHGVIHWLPIPMAEKKTYDDDGVRIGSQLGDDV